MFLENDYRCLRAGHDRDPAELLVPDTPAIVVLDPSDKRLQSGKFIEAGKVLLAAARVPVIVLGGDGTRLFDGRVPEIELAHGFSPADLREAIKTARWMAENPGAVPANDQATPEQKRSTARYVQSAGRPSSSKVRPEKGQKGSTARYDNPQLIPEDGKGDGPENKAGRRKRFKTTLSFKPRSVPTTPSTKALLVPPRRISVEDEGAPQQGSGQAVPIEALQTRPNLADTTDDTSGKRKVRETRELPGRPIRKLRRPVSSLGPADGTLAPGTLIANRYEVSGVLGTGGMAVVYQCLDTELDEEIALKLIKADRADKGTLERFRHEMRVCRRLAHPNIVRTYEFGVWEGRRFLTMELLDGRDLSQLLLIAQGPMELKRAASLMIQACEGLHAAHQVGVIHRDIKPHNMFVMSDSAALKIMDFGIAKTEDLSLTVPGSDRVLGTPAYLAPERLKEKVELSAKTDIYSLGVVMYQVFTGELPFVGPDISSLLTSIVLEDPPPPTQVAPDLPLQLEATILRAMAREPADRHSDCREIVAELQRL